jgi:hypothetical protein
VLHCSQNGLTGNQLQAIWFMKKYFYSSHKQCDMFFPSWLTCSNVSETIKSHPAGQLLLHRQFEHPYKPYRKKQAQIYYTISEVHNISCHIPVAVF